MTGRSVPEGALFYAETKRRVVVPFARWSPLVQGRGSKLCQNAVTAGCVNGSPLAQGRGSAWIEKRIKSFCGTLKCQGASRPSRRGVDRNRVGGDDRHEYVGGPACLINNNRGGYSSPAAGGSMRACSEPADPSVAGTRLERPQTAMTATSPRSPRRAPVGPARSRTSSWDATRCGTGTSAPARARTL